MADYGPGLTLAKCFSYDKERIRHALQGELIDGEDESGFTYGPAKKQECDRFIIDTFDNAVYQALNALCSGRALEGLMNQYGLQVSLREYMEAMEEESKRYQGDYAYENDMEVERKE